METIVIEGGFGNQAWALTLDAVSDKRREFIEVDVSFYRCGKPNQVCSRYFECPVRDALDKAVSECETMLIRKGVTVTHDMCVTVKTLVRSIINRRNRS